MARGEIAGSNRNHTPAAPRILQGGFLGDGALAREARRNRFCPRVISWLSCHPINSSVESTKPQRNQNQRGLWVCAGECTSGLVSPHPSPHWCSGNIWTKQSMRN